MNDASAPSPTSTPAPPDPQRLAAWHRADAEARASLAIVGDPSTDPRTACVHIVRGLTALAAVVDAQAEPHESLAKSPPAWGVPGDALAAIWRRLSDEDATEHVQPRDAREETDRPRRADRLKDTLVLVAGVRAAETELLGATLRTAERRLWLRRVGISLLILVPTIAGLVVTMPTFREGPWRGAYYPTRDFTGDPYVRRDGDIRFLWGEEAPTEEQPVDGFSVRWDTCLVLEEARDVAFQLTSDDGSRLWIDGEMVVDNWGKHDTRSRGERVQVDAGVHHLRIEYFDHKKDAEVTLVASLSGERPDALPVRVLRYPSGGLADDDPCAELRAQSSE